jgi:hypothetical protein
MVNIHNDKYKYWIRNPIEIDPEEDINKNVFNSPGYIIRDYRFYPRLFPADMSRYETKNGIRRRPSGLQLFYAWELCNEQQALKDIKKYTKYRKKNVKEMKLKRFTKMYLKRKKIYFIYNDIVREDCINLISKMIRVRECDDEVKDDIVKLYTLVKHLNLIINDYNESIYKEFVETLLNLIYYIFIIKFDDCFNIFNLITCQGINFEKYYLDEVSAHLSFDKLIIINKIIKSINL